MPDWKILLTDGLERNGQTILQAAAQVNDRNGIPPAELLQIIGDYDAVIVRSRTKVTAAVFAAASRLKVVGRSGVGVDNIDLEAAKAHGVTVVNAPVSTSLAVAELTLGLMLALARLIPRADAALKNGHWIKSELQGVELGGKTLGVLGMGNIGTLVAQRALALGMQVAGYDPLLTYDEIARSGAQPAFFDELIAHSDFISLHLPLTPQTRGTINAQVLYQMKHGVRLVCTARGGLIDEAALLAALQSGQVAGAALDVFAHEPPGKSELVMHPKVIATPHIGAQTAEAQRRAASDIAHEVLAILRGDEPRWKVA